MARKRTVTNDVAVHAVPTVEAEIVHDPIAENVRQTLNTVAQVLEHFESSLVRGGFSQGADAYKKMADTVLGQRLWSDGRAPHLVTAFDRVGQRARGIHAILAPYADAMQRLSVLASLAVESSTIKPSTVKANEEPSDPLTHAILEVLRARSVPLSLTALRDRVPSEKVEFAARLDALESAGVVRRHSSGSRALYSLKAR